MARSNYYWIGCLPTIHTLNHTISSPSFSHRKCLIHRCPPVFAQSLPPLHLFFFFWPRRVACGILVPRPGIKPVSPALEKWSPTGPPPLHLIPSDALLFASYHRSGIWWVLLMCPKEIKLTFCSFLYISIWRGSNTLTQMEELQDFRHLWDWLADVQPFKETGLLERGWGITPRFYKSLVFFNSKSSACLCHRILVNSAKKIEHVSIWAQGRGTVFTGGIHSILLERRKTDIQSSFSV